MNPHTVAVIAPRHSGPGFRLSPRQFDALLIIATTIGLTVTILWPRQFKAITEGITSYFLLDGAGNFTPRAFALAVCVILGVLAGFAHSRIGKLHNAANAWRMGCVIMTLLFALGVVSTTQITNFCRKIEAFNPGIGAAQIDFLFRNQANFLYNLFWTGAILCLVIGYLGYKVFERMDIHDANMNEDVAD